MTLSVYIPRPIGLTGVSSADVAPQQDKVGDPLEPQTFALTLGNSLPAKVQFENCLFIRFEVAIEAAANIVALKLELLGAGNNAGPTVFNIAGGFLKPQAVGVDWEDAAGFYEWADDLDVPFPEWAQGTGDDLTVFHGDAPGFASTLTVQSSVDRAPLSWVEGPMRGSTPVVGLIAQLESYLAANESLRGHTVVGAIPCCVCLYRPWSSIEDSFQVYYPQEWTGATTLSIEWSPFPSGVTARTFVGPAVTARASIQARATARTFVGPAATARASMQARATASAFVGPAATARFRIV